MVSKLLAPTGARASRTTRRQAVRASASGSRLSGVGLARRLRIGYARRPAMGMRKRVPERVHPPLRVGRRRHRFALTPFLLLVDAEDTVALVLHRLVQFAEAVEGPHQLWLAQGQVVALLDMVAVAGHPGVPGT